MLRILLASVFFVMSAAAAVKIEKTAYRGWPNCYRVSNGTVELIVTTDVGPRIIRYAFIGGQNLFKEFDAQLGHSGEDTWQGRGGHRLWICPEVRPDTYALDNVPVAAEVKGDVLIVTEPVEKESGVEKQISIKLAPSGSAVEIDHRVTNKAAKARRLAPWTLTQMAPGGMGIAGFPPRRLHEDYLLPTNPLTMWGFTDFSDPRWKFTKEHVLLKQDPAAKTPQKTGLFNPHTFGAYLLGSELFIKRAEASPSAAGTYPDFGCSFEIYTEAEFLELETLGPLSTVRPGAGVEHIERWSLHKNVHIPAWTDSDLDRVLGPLLK